MTQKIRLNGSESVNYLIHGQDLSLKFSFDRTFFVVINYNPIPKDDKFRVGSFWWFQRLHWFKSNGEFQSKVNFYKPQLTIYLIGWRIRKFKIPLKIERVLLKKDLPILKTPNYSSKFPKAGFSFSNRLKRFQTPKLILESNVNRIENSNPISLPWQELEKRINKN
jgi:hypothetical protein